MQLQDGIPGLGGCGPAAGAPAHAPDPAAFPCQKKNNSISIHAPRYALKLVKQNEIRVLDEDEDPLTGEIYAEIFDRYQAPDKREWKEHSDGTLELDESASSSERKMAFQFRGNAEAFINHFGRDHCAFWTITDKQNLHPREFAKRWNSFRTNEGLFILAFMRVLEPQKNGRPHYHFLVAVAWDLQPDTFDWDAYHRANEAWRAKDGKVNQAARNRYVESVPMQTRSLWKRLREVLPRYGLGRSEFLPLRKTGKQVSNYVAKYLESGLKLRRHEWKGCRRVEYSRRGAWVWKTHARRMSWTTPHAMQWRRRVGALAKAVGAADLDELAVRLGKHWAYRLRSLLIESSENDFQEWLRDELPHFRQVEAMLWVPEHRRHSQRFPHGRRIG